MALVSSPPCSPRPPPNRSFYSTAMATQSSSFAGSLRRPIRHCRLPITASHLCTHSHTFPSTFDRSLVTIDEAFSDDQLWAAACLRVRSFYHFQPNSFGVQVSLLVLTFMFVSHSIFTFPFVVWLSRKKLLTRDYMDKCAEISIITPWIDFWVLSICAFTSIKLRKVGEIWWKESRLLGKRVIFISNTLIVYMLILEVMAGWIITIQVISKFFWILGMLKHFLLPNAFSYM